MYRMTRSPLGKVALLLTLWNLLRLRGEGELGLKLLGNSHRVELTGNTLDRLVQGVLRKQTNRGKK